MKVMKQDTSWPAPSVEYPESDGQPMAESDEHADELRAAVETLRDHFATDPLAYVAGNNFLYFVEGDPRRCVSPDCYLVRGPGPGKRRTFKVWKEDGRTPSFVLELTSDSTRTEDLGKKMTIYRDDLEVPEYFLYDLTRDWIPEGVRGYRLEGGVYQPIAAGSDGSVLSRELGLELVVVGRTLRFRRPGAAEPLPRRLERAQRAEAAAEQERARAEQERARAEQERARADAAEAELKRLRALLEQGGGPPPPV
jgi:Uma2 family endonuclease